MNDKELFQQLQSKLSSFSAYSVIEGILDILFELDKNNKFRPYWHGFTLLQWAILYCSHSRLIVLKKANRGDVVSIFNDLSKIEDLYHKQELEKNHVNIFTQFHAIANQQFQYQMDVDKLTFPRQSILYSKIKIRKSKIESQFQEISILTIYETIVCLAFLHWFLYPEKFNLTKSYDNKLDPKYINTLMKLHGEEKFLDFINLITLNISSIEVAKEYVQNELTLRSPIFYIFNHSLFTQKPILSLNGNYRIIHRNLFNVTFRYFIYDKLKSKFKEKFTSEFGERIEKYVKIGLDELKIVYKSENELKKELKDGNKVVDYLVENNILIECKGIELHPLPSVSPTKENLSNYLKGSITKALGEQIINVIDKLKIPKLGAFALVVTYKELNIGFGKDIVDSIFNDEKIINKINNSIDSNKIFIIDIEEWDNLLSYIKHQNLTLTDILQRIVNEEAKTRRKSISMHLTEIYGAQAIELEYLNMEYTELMSKIVNSL